MIYISICITLLTLIAAMHVLAKSQKEGWGSMFKWLSYLILVVGILILLCQVFRGAGRMMHHGGKEGHEMGMHHGMCPMMGGGCHEEMECCEGRGMKMMGHGCCGDKMEKGGMDGCKGMKGCDDDDDDEHADSTHMMHGEK